MRIQFVRCGIRLLLSNRVETPAASQFTGSTVSRDIFIEVASLDRPDLTQAKSSTDPSLVRASERASGRERGKETVCGSRAPNRERHRLKGAGSGFAVISDDHAVSISPSNPSALCHLLDF